MCEFKKDFTNLNHHKKKIVYQLSCMRHFQSYLTEMSYKVNYLKLDDPNNHGDFLPELIKQKRAKGYEKLIVTEPSSYDELCLVKKWGDQVEVSLDIRKNNFFMCDKKEFEKEILSSIADLKNITASGVKAGSITAGVFLKAFVGDTPWCHLDIAGTAWNCQALGFPTKGGSAFGVRSLVHFCMESFQKNPVKK